MVGQIKMGGLGTTKAKGCGSSNLGFFVGKKTEGFWT